MVECRTLVQEEQGDGMPQILLRVGQLRVKWRGGLCLSVGGAAPTMRRGGYSTRSAVIGSIRLARRAGTKHAKAATAVSVAPTASSVSGSVGDTA